MINLNYSVNRLMIGKPLIPLVLFKTSNSIQFDVIFSFFLFILIATS
jgi:hypothetical protein